MEVKCPYCDSVYEETESVCPGCGAPNALAEAQSAPETDGIGSAAAPRTLEELKAFCSSKNMPLEKMRFFLGRDYRGERAFGIFQDAAGDFVVYKNKADGSRAIRYRGPDEARAVGEIYEKLRQEIAKRRSTPSFSGSGEEPQPVRSGGGGGILRALGRILLHPAVLILVAAMVVNMFAGSARRDPQRGYYRYQEQTYYYQGGDWYRYDRSLTDWVIAGAVDNALQTNYSNYFESETYSYAYGASDFSVTDYYDPTLDDSGGWSTSDDDDFDFDWDDWDIGDTDWDSDW